MAKFTEEDDNLIAELGIEYEAKKKPTLSAKEERIIAGFEEIQKFVEENNRQPSFDHEKDIFERLYATRLEQIRKQSDCIELLKDLDHQDLLNDSYTTNIIDEDDLDDDALLEELGLNSNKDNDLTSLRYVKPRAEMQPAQEIGQRVRCQDFEIFKPLFDQVQSDIKSGVRKVSPFKKDGSIEKGNLFILSGQKAYVAVVGELFIDARGKTDARLRVIFDNGVESNQLMRSLKKRLWDDKASRRITDISMGPLFDDQPDEDDIASGSIYVCQSQSNHEAIKANRNNIHKIGVTGQDVKQRLSGAENDPTFLFAKVDLVASFELYNISKKNLEKLLHRVFASARLEIEIPDRFGKVYRPKEWFCVPLKTIQDAVEKLKNGSLVNYKFNIETGLLEKS
ncbi:GIY-YIG nuclease family protein [Pseudomonadales bacterium]|nr:GIY-YIG nuclease family protein [Pseudomonadales bacterium]MDB4450855.1 GIY-YIG nuclease family protein [Pseudomonadales bacterium]